MSIDPAVQLALLAAIQAIVLAYLNRRFNSVEKKADALDIKVDGKISTLIQKVEAESALKIQVASLTATAAEREEGKAKADLVALQHDQLAAARALPPNDSKLVNEEKTQPSQQVNRIEQTGEDTNQRVQKMETNTEKRVADVEAKIDTKENKV